MTNLTKALLAVQGEIGSISKDSKNPFFKSNYLSLNGVREAVLPVLTKHKVVLLQPTVYQDGKTFIATRLYHSDTGEMIESMTEVVTKKVGDAQDFGSGMSYSRRYGLMSILCLSAEDDDGETAVGRGGKSASREMPKLSTPTEKPAVEAPPKKKVSFSLDTEGDSI